MSHTCSCLAGGMLAAGIYSHSDYAGWFFVCAILAAVAGAAMEQVK